MKHLILLTLTWNIAFSSNFCEIDDDGKGETLQLDCYQPDIERILTIKDKSVSCGRKDVLTETIKIIRVGRDCTFSEFDLFKNCTSVYFFSAGNIKAIQKETFIEMNQLDFIQIKYTNVEVMASAFSELPNLRVVTIAGNDLFINESAFQGAHQLKNLNFKQSSLSSLPPGFLRDLNNLEFLDFNGNKFSNLSTIDFTGLEKVKLLNFAENRISDLSGNWCHILKNLKYLILRNNLISNIDSMAFSQIHNLIALDMDKNGIEQLNASIFSTLTNLRILTIHKNYIYAIESGTFSTLKNLKKLDLSNNQLTALNEYSFEGLDNLQYLNLRGNQIETINVNTFSALTKLTQLDLSSQNALLAIDLNAFPQFVNLQTKTVIYTSINLESDDLEKEEVQWFKEYLLLIKKGTGNINEIRSFLFRPFQLNRNQDNQIDLHNLTQKIVNESLMFGNLDLSNNQINLINVD